MAIAVIANAVLRNSSINQAQYESIELKKSSNSTVLLLVKIKNAGNSPLSVNGQSNFDIDDDTPVIDPCIFVFTPTDLELGAGTVFVGDIPFST